MTELGHHTATAAPGRSHRRRRLPLVVMLLLGLMVSLFHCADDGLAFASIDQAAVMMTTSEVGGAVPDHQLPAHSGHCLSHVTEQAAAVMALPPDCMPRAPLFGGQQVPVSLAGLPLFKPPRA